MQQVAGCPRRSEEWLIWIFGGVWGTDILPSCWSSWPLGKLRCWPSGPGEQGSHKGRLGWGLANNSKKGEIKSFYPWLLTLRQDHICEIFYYVVMTVEMLGLEPAGTVLVKFKRIFFLWILHVCGGIKTLCDREVLIFFSFWILKVFPTASFLSVVPHSFSVPGK